MAIDLRCHSVSFFDDFDSFPNVGSFRTLYVDRSAMTIYIWNGTGYEALSGTKIIVVANYSALPDPTTVGGMFYWCSVSQGTKWLPGSLGGTYYPAGLYYSNGLTWEFVSTPYQATQVEVNDGINDDSFVTPKTLLERFAKYLQFNTTDPQTRGVGKLIWDDTDGTLEFGLKGGNVNLQIGQEQVIRVVNKTGVNLLESDYPVVRLRSVSEGGASGQKLAVKLAKADSEIDSATTLGVVTETILNNQEGFITTSGNINDINTTGSLQGETWVDGDMLFLSPSVNGGLTNIKPTAPNHAVVVGYVVYSHAVHGKIFIKVDNGYELEELHDVTTTAYNSPINTDSLLIFDITNSLWKRLSWSSLKSLFVASNGAITGATKTKITYDSKGLVTSGTDATTADIADSTNKRYVTDAQLVVIGNTSNTNTGDETTSTIKTKLGSASTSSDGYLTSTDWNTFNGKQNAIGFTPENVANKQTDLTASSTKYPTVDAVNTGLATKISGFIQKQINSSAVTGTTAETLVFTFTIPANTFSANDVMKFFVSAQKTGALGTTTIRLKHNTSNDFSTSTQLATSGAQSAGFFYLGMRRESFVIGNNTLRYYSATAGTLDDVLANANTWGSISFDTTAANYFFVSIQLSNSADSAIIRSSHISNL